jgi:hypothetical protein
LQPKLPHDIVVCAAHAPAPLQEAARVSLPAEQLWPAHIAVGYVHDEAPEQVPWHVPVPLHAARAPCGCPVVTRVHVPRAPATSHAWQDPPHAVSQQ